MDSLRRFKTTFAVYREMFFQSRPLQIAASIVIILAVYIFFSLFIKAPNNFPTGHYIRIKSGETLSQTASDLSAQNIIDHPTLFKVSARIFGGTVGVKAGDYFFDEPLGVVSVAYRLSRGAYGVTPIKVTIPEGYNVYDIGALLEQSISGFVAKDFVAVAKSSEGYLFPDTYYFMPTADAEDIVSIMKKNFDEKIATVKDKISSSGKSLKDLITMASILEEEARTEETRRIIAGILWKRLSISMPLQVDATVRYVTRNTKAPLTADQLNFDSHYNTYAYKGLPQGPISNPGLEAIVDAATPTATKYLYYLSDSKGMMHYAVTFDEHKKNKELYLR